MSTSLVTRIRRAAGLLAIAGVLASCEGGAAIGFHGGLDGSGIWVGSMRVDFTDSDEPSVLIVRQNGEFYLDSNLFLQKGGARTGGAAFSGEAEGHAYASGQEDGTDFSLGGNIVARSSLRGAFSSARRSGTFRYAYNAALSNLPASLPAIAGIHNVQMWVRDTAANGTVGILANGDFTATSTAGCAISGRIAVLDAEHNLYRWSGKLADCTVNGQASGVGFALGGSNDVYFVGRSAGNAVFFGGSPTPSGSQAPALPGQEDLQGNLRALHPGLR
jgi:hypothetical protein